MPETPPPSSAQALFEAALEAHRAGRLAAAEAGYRRALELDPDHLGAWNNLGVMFREGGRASEAEQAYRRVLALRPDYAEAHNNLGNLLRAMARPAEAETAYRRAVALRPDYAQAHHNLGMLLQQCGRPEEAVAALRRALQLQPNDADILNNLGVLLKESGRLAEVAATYRQALELRPDHAAAHYNLALLLKETSTTADAEAAYRRALALQPDYPEALNNLSLLLQETRRLDEAEVAYRQALALRPDFAEAAKNLGLLLLIRGRYAEAWPYYEQRYRGDRAPASETLPALPFPQWAGESLRGKSMVIWPEQGFGDYLQFVRFVPLLKARGVSRLTLVCAAPLKALLETVAGVDAVICDGAALAPHDFWSLPLSIPLHLGVTLDNLPATLPYLHALPARLAQWRPRLPASGFKVGLAWKGKPSHQNDARRSLAGLAALAELWTVPGVRFVSLQKGAGADEAARPPAGQPLLDLGAEIVDFADTAAIVAQLDLVICVDTAVAHVAGALGKPCWVLLPAIASDWRWLLDRDDSPWYPAVMRLWRQGSDQDWQPTLHQVAAALARRVHALAPPTPQALTELLRAALDDHLAGRLGRAEAAYRRVLELQPDYLAVYNNLGVLLKDARRPAEAEATYRRALELKPDYVEALNNLGNLLQETQRMAEAEAAYRRVVELKPEHAEAHGNLGNLLQVTGRPDAAEAAYRRAIALRPDFSEAHSNLGLLLLGLGRYAEAWPCHEHRHRFDRRLEANGIPRLPCPPWRGEALAGKALLVWPEQGYGDMLQFARFLPLLKARGAARVTLVCAEPLQPLLATLDGVELVTDPASLGAHDYWCWLLSLPLHLGTTLDNLPAALPYLHALPQRIERWRARLPGDGLRVGLVWKGKPSHKNDAQRSLADLSVMAPLWNVAGVRFVSLQKGSGADEARRPPAGQPLLDLGAEIADFADTAAIIAQLDLLICVDTAVAHLAGALGKPCWVLLPAIGCDWRWLHERRDSPWYPDVMRLFRQSRAGDWASTIVELAAALSALAASGATNSVGGFPLVVSRELVERSNHKRPASTGLRQAQAERTLVSDQQFGSHPAPQVAVDALFADALAAHRAGLLAQAEAGYRQVLAAFPDHADTLHLLGVVQQQNGNPAQAEMLIRRALAVREEATFLVNLGVLLNDSGRRPEAEAAYRRALALKPECAEAWNNLGLVLRQAMQLDAAEAAYRQAIAHKADYAAALSNLAVLMAYQERSTEAETAFGQALAASPDYPDANYNLGLLLLAQGRYAAAWPHYEYRHRVFPGGMPQLPCPQWQGESLRGKSLVIWAEQGLGDCIQFARYAPMLKALGLARLTLACAPSLHALLATMDGIDAVVAPAAVPAQDYWAFPMSLPLRFGTTLETIPARLPYLQAKSALVARWRDRLPSAGLKVGLVWKGIAGHKNDANRSLPGLSALAPLWDVPGVSFVSLQKGADEDAARQPPAGQALLALGHEIQDFADSAAIVAQLDLLICVDTAVAHLAGALGKPCWVLLPAFGTDWRWLQARDDSPWYPAVMRLFRQSRGEGWSATVAAVATALGAWAAPHAQDNSADLLRNALAAHNAGRLAAAEAGYRQILARHPQHLAACNNLGVLLKQSGRLAEAEAGFRRLLQVRPDYAETHYNLGLLLNQSGRPAEAEAAWRRALELKPDYPAALNNLGLLLMDSKRLAEAERCYRRALELQPDSAETHNNLANLLVANQRLPAAEAAYRRALELQPDYVDAISNLGVLLKETGRPDEAEAAYRRALQLQPEYARPRYNLSLLLLAQGRYAEAWPQYEQRYRCDDSRDAGTMPELPYPQWQGQSLAGKSLLLWPEQGCGDYLQFARYAPLLKARGLARLTLVCPTPLKAVLQTVAGVDAVTDCATLVDRSGKPVTVRGELVEPHWPCHDGPSTGSGRTVAMESQCQNDLLAAHDFWCLPLSLPLHLGTTLETIPASLPYLRALPQRIERWRPRLPENGLKVGLAWKGQASHSNDAHRSLASLAVLAPLWEVPGVSFVSLQKGPGEDEARQPPPAQPLIALGQDIEDFADTAAIIAQLDLLICVDTAVAHLAGALGKPCWVLLPAFGTDWRWLHQRNDSPWYPGVMRLFRQSAVDDWRATLAAAATALRDWAAAEKHR